MISLHSTNGCKGIMKKKSSDARGDINRNKILEYIKNISSRTWVGVQVNAIVEHTHLTRPTVTTHLNVLVAEYKIKKTRRGAYLPAEIFDDKLYHGWSYFEDYLNTHHPFFVTNPNILDLQDVANIILNLIEKDSITEPALAKYIFEYANRIGAYMMYVFIESLRSRRNVKSDDVRSILTEQLLTQAVPLMDLLEQLLLNIPVDITEKRFYELNDSALERISKSYKDLYPYIHKSIEEGYQRVASILHSNNDRVIEKSKNCIHEWKIRYVHKIGDLYFCPKCDAIVASPRDIARTASN